MKSESKHCVCDCCPCRNRKPSCPDSLLGEIVKFKPEITYNTERTFKSGKKAPDGIEIRFGDTRPTEEVRRRMKDAGFQFSERQKIWYALDNAKTRAFVQELSETEVDVDNAQYEKLHFWAKVKSWAEYEKLRPYTEFMISGEPPSFFFNKKNLEKGNAVHPLIRHGSLSFKKFYNKLIGDEASIDDEQSNRGVQQPKNDDSIAIAEKLKSLADAMQPQINAKINSATSRQRPTAKRLMDAAAMRQDGYKMQEVQTVLYALADAHRTGQIKEFTYLKNIRSKSQVEHLNYYETSVKQNRSNESLQNHFDRFKESYKRLGITSVFELSLANVQKRDLVQGFSPSVISNQNENEERIKALEMQVFFAKIPGFFPTPSDLIERLIKLANIQEGNAILEPSAGKGDILDRVKEKYAGTVHLDAVEQHSTLREILRLKGYSLVGSDFLEYSPGAIYDRIIMNPPFENSQDIDHVLHAINLIRPGGCLVAIMSEGFTFRPFKKDKAFRALLKDHNAYISEPIEGAFKKGFKTTGQNVRIVMIDKTGNKNENLDLLEIQALAELEVLKMQVENQRKRRPLNGLSGLDPLKLQSYKQRAFAISVNRIKNKSRNV